MVGHGTKFGRKKEEAFVALLSHRSIDEAARAVDISPNTLLHWLKDTEFDAGYREARRAAFSQSIARLQQMSGAAAATLGKVMVDPNTPASTKVRAADSILDHAAKAIEIEDIEVRVAALETATSHAVGLDPGSIDDYWRTSARWTPGMVLETPPTNRSGRFLAPVRLFSAVQTRSDPLTSKFLRNIVASL